MAQHNQLMAGACESAIAAIDSKTTVENSKLETVTVVDSCWLLLVTK